MSLKSSSSEATRDQQTVQIPAVLNGRGTSAKNAPIVAGFCLPKGRIRDVASGYVELSNGRTAAQFEVLNRWCDGTIRWMLSSFVCPEFSGQNQSVTVHASSVATSSVSSVDRTTTVRIINDELRLITRDFTQDTPSEHLLHITPRVTGVDGEELRLRFEGIREDVSGPVRQVFVVNARLDDHPAITLQFRLTFWASAGILQVETRLRNTQRARHAGGLWDLGDPGSFVFRSLEISVRSDEIPVSAMTHWRADRCSATRSTSHEVFLRQFGSGDRFWSSSNHVNGNGSVDVQTRGFEAVSDAGTLRGHRAEPTFVMEGDESWLAVAVPEFWQNFPASLAAAMGSLEVGLFPSLPDTSHELQGGEQKTSSFCIAMGTGPTNIDVLNWVYDSPRCIQSAESVSESRAIPWFAGSLEALAKSATVNGATANVASAESHVAPRFVQYLESASTDGRSWAERRRSIDEYGWRNFGDVPADHEQTHYAGSNTIVSHYNNQFDMIFGGILQWFATSDTKWFDLLDPLARHVMDIDIYHTNADRSAFNGGLFWHTDHYVDARTSTHRTYSKHNQKPGQPYGGGPSCEHNYTSGLLHYHFLTGSAEARDSVMSLAEWVIQMDDGRNTIFGLLDDGPTGAASATVFEDFHGPGRGAGNSVNALIDAWVLTGSERYLNKAEELIRRCVHPDQNPNDLHLLDAEGHWSYTVFLNSLGKYLIAKRDAEQFDGMYRYAMDVMRTYGRWMAANERRTLDHPEELQYPTEAWAAQDFRKANVLRIAASCETDPSHRDAMRRKADEINEAAWRDFEHFGDASYTARCLSIVMAEGHREVFHRSGYVDLIPECSTTYPKTTWSMFVPQKHRIKAILKSPGRLLKASVGILKPTRIASAWKALRRQL